LASYAVLITSTCGAITELLSGAYIQRRYMRVGIGLCFALLPVMRYEGIANVANLQFFLVAASFWVLLVAARSKAGIVLSTGFLGLTAASTLVGFVLFPIAVVRLLKRTSPVPALVFLGCEVLHFAVVVVVRPKRVPLRSASLLSITEKFLKYVVANQLIGSMDHLVLTCLVVGVAGALSLILVLLYWEPGTASSFTLGTATILIGGATYLLEALVDGTPPRYAVVPAMWMLFGIAIIADGAGHHRQCLQHSSHRKLPVRVNPAIMVGAVVIAWGIKFPASHFRETGPRWSTSYAKAERTCRAGETERIPIVPVGWSMTLLCPPSARGGAPSL